MKIKEERTAFLLKSSGHFDIKQSLSIKRRQDRTEALRLPDDSDPSALYELGLKEYKSGNTETAVVFITKAMLMIIKFYKFLRILYFN